VNLAYFPSSDTARANSRFQGCECRIFRPQSTRYGKFDLQKSHEVASSVKSHLMDDESLAMSEQRFIRPANADTEIELLARETAMPRDLVAKLYTSERAKLERTARIKTYIPVLLHRHVKALLRQQLRH